MILWDLTVGKEIHRFTSHTSAVASVGFSSEGKYAISGSWDKTLRVWDLATRGEVCCFEAGSLIYCAAVFRDGHRVLAGCDDGTLHLWDIVTGQEEDTGGDDNVQAAAPEDDRPFDFQLARAVDLLRGVSLFGRKVVN